MLAKPGQCAGCPLEHRGQGFAPPYGNPESALIVIAEALGANEAAKGEPLVGEAGVYWQRALHRLGLHKQQLYIGNTVNCRPPGNWLTGASYEQSAIRHCFVHRKKFYLAPGSTYLTMGVAATRTVLKEVLDVDYSGDIENWQGYVIGRRPNGPFVIPTFHPSHVLQGNHRLFGAFLFAIKRAMEVASFGFNASNPQLIVDPPPTWFGDYVEQIPDDPEAWLATDTETGETEFANPRKGRITRWNFAMHPDQGVTVPNEERYRFAIRRAMGKKCTKVFWNERFDLEEISKEGIEIAGETLDGMWGWHMLQSDLPKGLGFVAPFYSDIEPWKHLNVSDPGKYAAIDPVQTLRIMLGLKKDLTASGQWESFMRYATQLDHQAIYPMEKVGIGVHKPTLLGMSKSIATSIEAIEKMIQQYLPKEALPWVGGWKREPDPSVYTNAFKATVQERVIVCTACKEQDVTSRHKCDIVKAREAALEAKELQ